jgi:hypothetical protein
MNIIKELQKIINECQQKEVEEILLESINKIKKVMKEEFEESSMIKKFFIKN